MAFEGREASRESREPGHTKTRRLILVERKGWKNEKKDTIKI
jgi:hypothetical protein